MVRLSKEEARALGLTPARSKYNNNKPSYYDPDSKQTLTFDSNKELEYYLLLKDRQKRGEIYQLQRQVTINIQPRFYTPKGELVKEINYKADFCYLVPVYDDNGVFEKYENHIIDVKGYKTDVYKLKKKLLAYKGFYIEEV